MNALVPIRLQGRLTTAQCEALNEQSRCFDRLTPYESLLRLWRAILLRALHDAAGIFESGGTCGPSGQNIREKTVRWTRSHDFDLVCQLAERDPPVARRKIEDLSRAAPGRPQAA